MRNKCTLRPNVQGTINSLYIHPSQLTSLELMIHHGMVQIPLLDLIHYNVSVTKGSRPTCWGFDRL